HRRGRRPLRGASGRARRPSGDVGRRGRADPPAVRSARRARCGGSRRARDRCPRPRSRGGNRIMTIETKTTKVLIVDDERLFAELLRVALRNADGIEVVDVVHDVQTAARRMSELRPGVVLADYHLPDCTGSDIARSVRATLRRTSVPIPTPNAPGTHP